LALIDLAQRRSVLVGLLALFGLVALSHGIWMCEKKNYYRHDELINAIRENTAAVKETRCSCGVK
jgi:hypothetical protein